jgi:two-component system chemotaxis response regulator CheB
MTEQVAERSAEGMTADSPLKVLVVDDALFYRSIVSEVLSEIPGARVVGTAANGKIAVQRIGTMAPDLLTLDIEMPEMDGLEVLAWMGQNVPHVGAIVLSAFTKKGGELTVKALNLGAFDFIEKTEAESKAAGKTALKAALAPKLRAFARRREVRSILNRPPAARSPAENRALRESAGTARRVGAPAARKAEVVGLGVSTGGPQALGRVLAEIPADFPAPILVVQHMPAAFTQSITGSLNAKCAIEVRAARDGEPLAPGVVLFAPGGTQMKLKKSPDGRGVVVRVTDDRPENSCKPSVDYLFRSLAHLYGPRAAAVIMTGMGSDGTLGLKLMKRAGATIIAQNEETCTVFGMPKEPIESGIVDIIAPLDRIAEEIRKAAGFPSGGKP